MTDEETKLCDLYVQVVTHLEELAEHELTPHIEGIIVLARHVRGITQRDLYEPALNRSAIATESLHTWWDSEEVKLAWLGARDELLAIRNGDDVS